MDTIKVDDYKEININEDDGVIKITALKDGVDNETFNLDKLIKEIKPIEVLKNIWDSEKEDKSYYIVSTEKKKYLLIVFRKKKLSFDINSWYKWYQTRIRQIF